MVELLHLSFALARVTELTGLVRDQEACVLLDCVDGDVVIVAGSLMDNWEKPLGVWLDVSFGYPAPMIARDVATLSWLVELDHVVLSAEHDAEAHAQAVRALLTNDEVTFTNEVVTLTGAYNRPAPPRPLNVWSYDGRTMSDGSRTLGLVGSHATPLGTLDRFA